MFWSGQMRVHSVNLYSARSEIYSEALSLFSLSDCDCSLQADTYFYTDSVARSRH